MSSTVLRVRFRVGRAFAVKLEHLGRVSDERIADLPHARVGRQVIVALANAQSALTGVGEQPIRVFQIRAGAHSERSKPVRRLQFGQRDGDL
jgi:hypothetical protein